MNIFRKLSTSRRRSDTTSNASTSGRSPNNEFAGVDQIPEHEDTTRGRSRTISLGSIFSRRRPRQFLSENYTTDFWVRNFSEKSIVSWHEFRAAFVLDYKNALEEFSDTGHLSYVLEATHDELCNKDSIVYIARYRRFVGSDTSPDAMWNKIKEKGSRRVFEEGLRDSLCL